MKLSTRIFALAFANVVLLAAVFLAFAHYQFHLNFRSFLVAPAEDRVGAVSRAVASDLMQTPVANRTGLMGRYAATYGADFYLFDNLGTQLAGKPVQLPPDVKQELTRRPPDAPPVRRDPPPPAREDAPPPVEERRRPPPREDLPPPLDDGTFPPPPPGRGPDGSGFRLPPPPERDMQGPGAPGDLDSRPSPPRRQPPPRAAVSASGATKPTASELLANVTNARYQTSQFSKPGLYWVMTRVPIVDPSEGNVVRGTLFMVAPSFFGTPLFFDFKPWLWAFAAAIAIFLICWLPFLRGLSRSISRVTLNTGRIAEGDFENHLPENRSDEIGQLSVSINRMAGRLSGFVTGQKRFLGDIAHELSAPIARVQFALGILEQRANDDQHEAVDDLREEIAQMSGLVNELLSFSKAGLEAGSTALKAIDVVPIIRQAAARETSGSAQIVITESEPVIAMAEPNLLLRAASNIVRNAVRYAGADGPVTISARREDDAVIVTVADSGPGLPTEELDRVFAPFYRPDTSRTRDTGGAGLGLAIVKSCIEASGGTVQCRNREPHGLEVEIRLKAANI